MTLYFKGNRGDRCIAHPDTQEEIFELIQKFLAEHNFKSYYIRMRTHEGVTKYDVGSWTEFFESIEETTNETPYWNLEDFLNSI